MLIAHCVTDAECTKRLERIMAQIVNMIRNVWNSTMV